MRLDDGEIIALDIQPDKKVLGIWFFTKTITYSMAVVFFVFMAVFFVNTISLVGEVKSSENAEVVEASERVEQPETPEEGKVVHPFSQVSEYWPLGIALLFAVAIVMQLYVMALRKSYRYIVTNRRCIFVGGIFKRIERTVPYKKITDIQRSQNILERVLGIWNVQVFTPGTASIQLGQAKARAELNFDGLVNSEDVYEIIHKYTQSNG